MRFFFFLTFLNLMPLAASGAEAISGDVIQLDDGRMVRLRGIKAEGDTAQSHLQSFINDTTITTEGAALDRYGQVLAETYTADGTRKTWLQGAMLQAGDAFVYPPTGSEPHLAEMLKLEGAARKAKRGLWNDSAYADLSAADPARIPYGQFAFIAGKVVQAERIKNMFYLNFGEDWRQDFTIAIAAHDLRLFKKAGIDPATYEGKTIRVRGWVKRNFGPMITVTHPAQIEILGEAVIKP